MLPQDLALYLMRSWGTSGPISKTFNPRGEQHELRKEEKALQHISPVRAEVYRPFWIQDHLWLLGHLNSNRVTDIYADMVVIVQCFGKSMARNKHWPAHFNVFVLYSIGLSWGAVPGSLRAYPLQ
ncbi:hypothetical protein XELAEV_18026353mg [Xenopus laevis]|uniref:Uncharacterized protein n=1 Tax=Xenopus laevis TaxID=8355 RepID=A0A974CVG4_XENLA|nr:hypothetical protein XELAEV_18026353mg [Xenopus laevis]